MTTRLCDMKPSIILFITQYCAHQSTRTLVRLSATCKLLRTLLTTSLALQITFQIPNHVTVSQLCAMLVGWHRVIRYMDALDSDHFCSPLVFGELRRCVNLEYLSFTISKHTSTDFREIGVLSDIGAALQTIIIHRNIKDCSDRHPDCGHGEDEENVLDNEERFREVLLQNLLLCRSLRAIVFLGYTLRYDDWLLECPAFVEFASQPQLFVFGMPHFCDDMFLYGSAEGAGDDKDGATNTREVVGVNSMPSFLFEHTSVCLISIGYTDGGVQPGFPRYYQTRGHCKMPGSLLTTRDLYKLRLAPREWIYPKDDDGADIWYGECDDFEPSGCGSSQSGCDAEEECVETVDGN